VPKRNEFATESEWLEHLRIYFAAKAMEASLNAVETANTDSFATSDVRKNVAVNAYAMADAMIAARKSQ